MKLTNDRTVIDVHPSNVDNMIRKGWKEVSDLLVVAKPKAPKKAKKAEPEVAEFDGEILIVNEEN
ncbi:MAG: hypothetical protein GY889_13165 [Proteobacteria bacterium]|nr:hypothetical protein [Pseudomonadota bacterium]MCP4973987.1 hypothetical protein [Prochlorococcus sp.]